MSAPPKRDTQAFAQNSHLVGSHESSEPPRESKTLSARIVVPFGPAVTAGPTGHTLVTATLFTCKRAIRYRRAGRNTSPSFSGRGHSIAASPLVNCISENYPKGIR